MRANDGPNQGVPSHTPTTLTYAILFKDPVTDEDVVAIADAILHQRGYGDAPEDLYAQAVDEAVDERRAPKERDYLQRLVRVMDAKRPWPILPYATRWPGNVDLDAFTPVGSIPLSPLEIEDRLRRSFRILAGHEDLLLLELDTGHAILLQANSSHTEPGVAVLTTSRDRADEVVGALRQRTGLPTT